MKNVHYERHRGGWRVIWTDDDSRRRQASGFDTRAEAEAHLASLSTPTSTLVYRAMDDNVPLGLYTTVQAAQDHADHEAPHDAGLWLWLASETGLDVEQVTVTAWSWEASTADDEPVGDDEPLVLYATVGGEQYGTGYTVLPLSLHSRFDPEAEG
ncbi:hypothetical protein [Streptacidiphilus albus]|uniref:hypothetical protein n=1 Tax=Streptacidiphilus albus TaxID=105425 RepID=UPI00054C3726|nr:hypothetical protein [Streptacidiphilus albus]